jgi:hypothetical protein
VTLSSEESEYVSLTDMICEVKYLWELARGLGFGQTETTLIYEDDRVTPKVSLSETSRPGFISTVRPDLTQTTHRFKEKRKKKMVFEDPVLGTRPGCSWWGNVCSYLF